VEKYRNSIEPWVEEHSSSGDEEFARDIARTYTDILKRMQNDMP